MEYTQTVSIEHRGLADNIYKNFIDPNAVYEPVVEDATVTYGFRLKRPALTFRNRFDAALALRNPPKPKYAHELSKKLSACLPIYRALIAESTSETERADWKIDLENIQQAYDSACEEARK